MPSVPHTGSSSTPAGGHDRGQFDEIALLSLLDFSTTAGWVPGTRMDFCEMILSLLKPRGVSFMLISLNFMFIIHAN